jgi:putative transposase
VAAAKGEKTLAELAQQIDVHLNLINQWRAKPLKSAADLFGGEQGAGRARGRCDGVAREDWLAGAGGRFFVRCAREGPTVAERKAMIDRCHNLPVSQQARQLGISRASIYYLPRPVSASDLALMRRVDELHMTYPFARSRMLCNLFGGEGVMFGRLHIAMLMKKMGVAAIYRRPNISNRSRTGFTRICCGSWQ